jgi:hypothetical protein
MRRSVLVILIVALLSAWISRAERVSGDSTTDHDWVRTSRGWEHRSGFNAARSQPPLPIHPGLIAAFQLGASLFVLLAFPGRAVPAAASRSAAPQLDLARQNSAANRRRETVAS